MQPNSSDKKWIIDIRKIRTSKESSDDKHSLWFVKTISYKSANIANASRRIYQDGMQYKCISDVIERIDWEWYTVPRVYNFPRYVMKYSIAGKTDTTRNISCSTGILFSSTFRDISRKFGLLFGQCTAHIRLGIPWLNPP